MNKKVEFNFECALMGALKPRDREQVDEVLRHLNRYARETLSAHLLDYMEGKGCTPHDVLLGGAYLYLTKRIKSLKLKI